MRRRLLGLAVGASLALAFASSTALAAPGDLDPSFGSGGRVVLTPGGRETVYTDVAIQPDGKIVLAGYTYSTAGDTDIAVTRLNANGTPDTGFAAGGTLAINTNYTGTRRQDLGYGVALQPDGKILVVGETEIQTGTSATIARILPNGTVDPDFAAGGDDGDGITWSALGAGYDVAVDKSGRIIAAGVAGINSWVERLNPDGSRDNTFGTPGLYPWVLSFDLGGDDTIARLALLPDGRVLGVGSRVTGTADIDAVVARIAPGAGLDSTFGESGFRTYGFGAGSSDEATDLVVEPGGKIDVAGSGSAANAFALTRLTASGNLDPSFSGKSTVAADFGSAALASAVALQANGKIVLAGDDGKDFAVARFQPGGTLDTTFGPGGKRTVSFPNATTTGTAMALQPDGKVVVVGYIGAGTAASGAVVRLQGDSKTDGGGPGGGGGGGKAKVYRCGGKRATIVGTNKRNKLRGTRRADVIVGLGGNDTISGVNGNDVVCGGSGNDKVSGGKGNDKLYGDAGKDSVSGDAGNDRASGGSGNDKVSGGPGKDKLAGDSGKDALNGGSGKDALNGGAGKDKCAGRDREKGC
jgi:uncharacterized delta-60 repeat protein